MFKSRHSNFLIDSKKMQPGSSFTVFAFFAIYLVIGLNSFADFGVSWDEPTSRVNGLVNLKYVGEIFSPALLTNAVTSSPDLSTWRDKDYGVAFELPLATLEQLFGLIEARDIFLFRHLATFLFYYLGVIAIYRASTLRFRDYRYGLLAALIVIASPRFFAESFYNSKDAVFMAAFAIAAYTMTRLLLTPNWTSSIIHGLASAFATDVRIMGVMLIIVTMAFLLILTAKKELKIKKLFALTAIFIVSYIIFTVTMFPWLWESPLENFILAFKNMSAFRWGGEILFLGENIRGANVPWHYIPTYIVVTTPIFISALFALGALATTAKLIRSNYKVWHSKEDMQDLLHLTLLLTPILAVIILNSVLYDGWRQLYFIYPSFVLLAMTGISKLFDACKSTPHFKPLIKAALTAAVSLNVIWIYTWHPHQNVYFNSLVRGEWRYKFDVDYWGLSNTQALRKILAKDSSPIINVWADSFTSLDTALLSLTSSELKRVRLSRDTNYPLYVINNYRQSTDMDGESYRAQFVVFDEIRIDGQLILTTYKYLSH